MDFARRYTIIEEIGHGGMGRVYKAIDRSLGISVALKIIRPEYASNPRIIDLFKKETVLARSITSENVVRVHDLGEWENIKYISMDFVEGENLRDLIRASGSLTISAAVKFGQQICSGLAAAHKEGIIHRDLKPSNVTIDRLSRARVMDFGLAKTLDREDSKGIRAVVGTPEYISPEQARGERLDQRTDIYALGLILYEMVTGRCAFEADSLTGYIKKHCEVDPEPPSHLNPLVPPGLENIILRCLRKDKNERYQSAEEVCEALELVVAPEMSKVKSSRPWILRLLPWVAACLIIAVLVFYIFLRDRAPSIPSIRKSIAVLSFENVTGDPTQEKWRAIRNLLLMDLEQSRFLRLVTRERLLDCLNDLHIKDAGIYAQAELDKIAATENVDFFLLGSYIASGEKCRIDIRIVDTRTHENVGSRSFNVAGFEETQDRCDEISRWTKETLGFTRSELAKDFDRELKRYTSQSIDALVHFFRGLEFYDKRDFEQSSEAFLKAVAADRDFALAYAHLAFNFSYEGQLEEANRYIQKAMSLRKNLIPRERLLIEGDFYNLFENEYETAIGRYEALLRDYPDDEMALERQGSVYRNTEQWDKAERCFERLRAINPRSRIITRNLIQIAEAMGNYEKAERVLQDNKEVFSASGEFLLDLVNCLFCQGRTDQALIELENALSIDPTRVRHLEFLGHIQTVLGDYRDAETAYQRLLKEDWTDREKLKGRSWLGQLYLLRGQYDNCLKEIEEGLRSARKAGLPGEELTFLLLKSYFHIAQDDFVRAYEAAGKAKQQAFLVRVRESELEVEALHLMGLCQVELGQVSEARRTVLEMEQIIDKMGYPKLLRNCFYLEGMIAGAGNLRAEAVAAFRKAVASLPHQRTEYLDRQAVYIEALASCLFQQGDLDSARAEYEKVISLTTGRLTAGNAYARSLFQLGRICQEKNEPAAAREFFRRYLAVRGSADAGLAEVEDARKRLASLS